MKINYALSGLGGIAKIHTMGLKKLPFLELPIDFEVNFSMLATTSPHEKEELAAEIGFDNIVDSFDELLTKDVDMVDLCTPNFVHKEEIMKAIAADKHIYCEKPLALDLEEAEEIIEQIDQTSLKDQMGFVYRFLPAVAKAHALLKNKVIGKVQFAKVEYYHSRYLNPEVGISWRLQKETSGGGALVDLGSHMIDLTRFLLGDFSSVGAWTKTFVKERKDQNNQLTEVDVDDWAMLMVDLASGANATIESSRVSPGNEGFRVHIFGDQGSIYIDSDQIEEPTLYDQTPKEVEITAEMIADDDFLDNVLRLYPNSKLSQGLMIDLHTVDLVWFLESIAQNKKPIGTPDFKAGYEVQKIIDYAYQSASKNGKRLKIK